MESRNGSAHPYDTPISGGLRFLAELIAWVAGPWAASLVSPWLIVPVLVVLVGLPSVFSTPGDKKQIVVPTPGPVRLLIEALQFVVAAIAPWFIWPTWVATLCVFIVIATIGFGIPRMIWLARGAPAGA